MSEDPPPHPLSYRRIEPPPPKPPQQKDKPLVIQTRIPIDPISEEARFAGRPKPPTPKWADGFGMAACVVAALGWLFLLYWVTGGADRWGVIGMLIMFGAGVLTFIADLITHEAQKSRWTTYAGLLAATAVLVIAFLKVLMR